MDFKVYLTQLEQVVCKGIGTIYTTQTKFWVKDGKLEIPELIGDIDTDKSIVISYYGFPRKSKGFRNDKSVEEKRDCYLIQFNQIHLEHILKLEPTLIHDFMSFKQELVWKRWGNEKS